MKYWPCCFLMILLSVHLAYAQKVNLEKWVKHTVDSLRKDHVDSIEYYHAYCGECFLSRKPIDTLPTHQCDVGNGWDQRVNDIIYKQKDRYYSMTFNCGYPPIKKELKNLKSLNYFLSIVPVLIKRDKYGAAMQRRRKFNPPIIVDGFYEEAFLYYGNAKEHIFMHDDQKTDNAWRAYFWIDKQTKLLEMLESETSSKD